MSCCHENFARSASTVGQPRHQRLPIGLGTVKLGRDQGVKYPSGFTIPDDHEAQMLLKLARDLGINLIDTAPAYGRSEERLGPLLRGQRQDWVIVSKVGEEFEAGHSRHDFSAAHTRLSVERSLKRLETDFIDLVLVHSDGNDLHVLNQCDVYPTLADLKREGKIRGFGFQAKPSRAVCWRCRKATARWSPTTSMNTPKNRSSTTLLLTIKGS